jgi:hypothetical protein
VFDVELDDVRTTHLHPRDLPGAIVSLDQPDPPASWRWGGPDWTPGPGELATLTVATDDPKALAARWAAVLDVPADGASIPLGDQRIDFVAGDDEGIVALALRGIAADTTVCGVRVTGDQ